MSWPVIVRNLTKRFGDRTVLDGVSLTIPPGETVALIGPSGSGKSTLLRCLNGLNTFDAGEIQVGPHRLLPGGHSSSGAIAQVRRAFGMIFQDFQLFPHLCARDNITEAPMRVLGFPVQRAHAQAAALLERVGLSSHADAFPQQLSGGQKQRVAIARALAMEPRGLLCDEITSALDPELKTEVLSVLETLKRDGLTLILVTHEIGFARRAADRVVMLCDGRILEEGPPAEILERPKTERMALFLKRVLG
ncbi:MAG: amino acid ABC transporter ATP-binding protein [Planctomycetes bacterium]|nr:amino acid ABC transporter ATP-binding protein [Planctomycetota bacterium]